MLCVLALSACSVLAPAVEDLSQLLARGFEDAFPDAKKAAAAALVCLTARLPSGALDGQAERLLQVGVGVHKLQCMCQQKKPYLLSFPVTACT